jgi:hypothetical protein
MGVGGRGKVDCTIPEARDLPLPRWRSSRLQSRCLMRHRAVEIELGAPGDAWGGGEHAGEDRAAGVLTFGEESSVNGR